MFQIIIWTITITQAIVDMVDENGATCLHLCSINRSYEIAELLIKNGANVNAMATHDEGVSANAVLYLYVFLIFNLYLKGVWVDTIVLACSWERS